MTDERCICGDLEPAHARIHCPVHGLFAGLTREQLRDRAEAAERELARLREGLRPFVDDYDFHAADYLANLVDGEEARVFTARTVESLIEDQRKARALLTDTPDHALPDPR